MAFNIVTCRLIFRGKLQFAFLNYALDYTLHHKLSDCTLCTLYYHTLHPSVIFAIIFNRIMLHATNTCFLLRWNKVKRLKHPSSKSNKTKPIIFPIFSFKIFKFTSLIPWQNLFIVPHPTSPNHCLFFFHHQNLYLSLSHTHHLKKDFPLICCLRLKRNLSQRNP